MNVWIVWGCVISTALVVYVVAHPKIRAESKGPAFARPTAPASASPLRAASSS